MTAPEDQNGPREALAPCVAEALAEFQKRYGYHRPVIEELLIDFGEIVAGLAAADRASLIAERDAAVATVAEVEEWTGSRDGWPSLKAKMDLIVIGAEKAEDRHDAEEARANAIQATLDAEMEIQAEVRASLRAAEAEITRLKEGMEALGAALRPFAVRAPGPAWPDDFVVNLMVRARDLRAAQSLLATLSPKEQP